MISAKLTERGWAGHFICADRCGFRRNTLLECNGEKVVVSTVGNYRPKGPINKPQTIGHNRYYETMAFEAKMDDAEEYWEADVSKEVTFHSPWMIPDLGAMVDTRADLMHNRVCQEITHQLEAKHNNL